MKKYINQLFVALMVVAGFSACSDSDNDNDYSWASASGEQVYFPNTLPSRINIAEDGTSFDITLNRINTKGELTVALTVDDATGTLTIPSSVTFADGESAQNLSIGYDPADFEYADYKTVVLTVTDESLTTPYGAAAYTFTIGKPEPFLSLGKGTLYDDFFEAETTVEILQNQNAPNVFRIMYPYDGISNDSDEDEPYEGDEYMDITLLNPGDVLAGETITEENTVYFTTVNTGYYHSNYEDWIKVYHPSEGFTATPTADTWTHSKVLVYQENGMPGQIQLAPFYYMDNAGGWNYSGEDGMIIITLPGYEKKDYSLSATLLGVLTSVDNLPFAAFTATLGEDVAQAKAAVVSADDDADEVAAALADGTLEGTAVANGTVYVPIAEGLTGKLQVVVAGITDGEAVAVETLDFEYWGGGANPWTNVATGDYIYTMFFANEDGSPYTDAGLDLEYNADDDVYRITNWGNGVDFTFTFDETTNAVNVPAQQTGYTYGNYGPVYVGESDEYSAANGGWDDDDEDGTPDPDDGPSYYDAATKTFHFNVAYFVAAGYFDHGEETFTISDAAARSVKARAQAAKTAKANLQAHKAAKRAKVLTQKAARLR